MPHKHKRKEEDKATFDLPPSSRAKPLPVHRQAKKEDSPQNSKPQKRKLKSKSRKPEDDTPRAFARLMQIQKTGKALPSGLDNGDSEKRSKKRKRTEEAVKTSSAPEKSVAGPQHPKILPGERLSDFALRVDQALPLSLPRHQTTPSSASKITGLKERSTKHNRRLLKMQEVWREEERRRKEKREEELDELEDKHEEEGLLWNGVGSKRTKKGKQGKGADDDEDPWAELAKSRAGAKQKNLQDVVQAPPQLKKVKSKFRDRRSGDGGVGVDVANVPGSIGSLRRREEMGATRRAIIDSYRRMMRKDGQSQGTMVA